MGEDPSFRHLVSFAIEGTNYNFPNPHIVRNFDLIPTTPITNLQSNFVVFPRDLSQDVKNIIQWPENQYMIMVTIDDVVC